MYGVGGPSKKKIFPEDKQNIKLDYQCPVNCDRFISRGCNLGMEVETTLVFIAPLSGFSSSITKINPDCQLSTTFRNFPFVKSV